VDRVPTYNVYAAADSHTRHHNSKLDVQHLFIIVDLPFDGVGQRPGGASV
jgi:hypothetical protein